MALHARFGIPEYWIVDPVSATLNAYVLEDQTYHPIREHPPGLARSRGFPGLVVTVDSLFG